VIAAAVWAEMAASPRRSTDGICPTSTSRSIPADAGDGAQDDGRGRPQSQAHRLAGPGDGEQAQAGGVQHSDQRGQPGQLAAERERRQAPRGGHREVTPVAERGRRQGAEEDVADDPSAQIPSYLARGATAGAAGGALISAASRAGYAAACITAPTPDSHRKAVSGWLVRHSPCTTWPGRSRELPGSALSTGTSRRGDGGTCSSLPAAAESRNLRDGMSRRPARGSR
jgi:hypothetical protein